MLGSMALLTFDCGVLSLENVASLLVVEGPCVPLDQSKIEAIVLGMALGTLLAGSGADAVREVQSPARAEAGRNFGVTVEALEDRFAAKFVTSSAVSGAVEIRMGARKRPGRYLGGSGRREQQNHYGNPVAMEHKWRTESTRSSVSC